ESRGLESNASEPETKPMLERFRVLPVAVAVGLAACTPGNADTAEDAAEPEVPAMNALTSRQRADGWQLLFDGTSLGGWRGYNRQDLPAGWEAVDGALTRTGPGGDIITRDQYE